MKQHTERLRLVQIEQLAYSANGNPRWKFSARTDDGQLLTFKTASKANSVFDCNMNRLQRGSLILATYHRTAKGSLVADSWGDSHKEGIDLSRVVAVITVPPGFGTPTCKSSIKPTGDHHG